MAVGAGPRALQPNLDSESDPLPSGRVGGMDWLGGVGWLGVGFGGSSDEGDAYGDAGGLGPLRRLVAH